MKRGRRFLAVLLAATSLMSVSAYAETVYFQITIPGDTVSKKRTNQIMNRFFM